MENEKVRGYVVSHTHWDREWYLTFQEYRMRLIKVLDRVIKYLKEEPEFRHFMLDGQTSALEDYLEVRSNAREEIRELVARGKMLIGPWFTQPDEALASPEALVRNLLIGHRIAEQFGHVMKVGYLPDTFGHVAQIPQILRGFNIDNVVFMRGLGDEGERLGFEFIWKAPSGDKVTAIHLINGYCNANMIGAKIASYSTQIWEAPVGWKSVFLDLYYSEPEVDTKEAIERLEQMAKGILPTTKSRILLLMNGCDHMPPQRGITEVIREANNSGKFELKHGTLEEYINEVEKFKDKMLEYEGELRGARFHPLLVSSISSRMYLKQMNYQAQAVLEKYAEPLATIAKMYGFEYPAILLLEAWKEILRNHAHDSIYGTGIDPVHKENETRFLKAIEIGTNVAYDSIRFLSNLLNFEEDKYAVTSLFVFNPHPYYLTEKVSMFLPIEKGSYKCIDEKGNETKAIAENEESYWTTGNELEFVAKDLPPMGFKLYRVYNATSKFEKSSGEPFVIENEYFRVFADPKRGGALKVEDKEAGKVLEGLNVFVDDGDVGDEYNYSPPKELDKVVTSEESEASIEVLRSEVKQSFRIKTVMKIPKCAEGQKRSNELVEIPVNVLVDLFKGKRRIDVKVSLENIAEDHRLRVKFNSGLKTDYSYADSQFYVQKRSIKPTSEGKNWVESPPTTHPQLFWVNVNDGRYGLTVASKGLPEYEVKEEGGATIYVTLFRAVGWLSRGDLATRKGHAGPQIATPEAQCKRKFTFEYSIIPHKGNWFDSRAYKEAYSFAYPPLCIVPVKGNVETKQSILSSYLQLEPDNLVLTALKKAEDNDWVVARFFNISNENAEAKISTGFNFREAWKANLNEEPLVKVASNGREAKINVKPYEIVTIVFKL